MMRYIAIDNVKLDQLLGKNIYSANGKVLLRQGTPLDQKLASKLKELGITAIYIQDQLTKDIEQEEIISDKTKQATINVLSEAVKNIQGSKDFEVKSISQQTGHLLDEILDNKDNLISLNDILTKDNRLFIHSLNVTIIAVTIGVRLGLNEKQLQELAIGALFHDVGKIVPDRALDKLTLAKGNITEHTWRGFYYLKKKHEISMLSSTIALQHHELLNGIGSPRGLKQDEIHLYAKIVAVANYYDNLITPSATGQRIKPHEACEKIMGLTNTYFEHDIVWQFLRSIAAYPNGTAVKLSTNQIGIVVGQHKGLPMRPIIRVIDGDDINQASLITVEEIDLAEQTTIFIEEVLE